MLKFTPILLIAMLLAGCNDSSSPASPTSSASSDPGSAAALPTTSNTPPNISGNAVTVVQAGSVYSFTPSSSDADGDTLIFAILNKPSWAAFNASTGQLYGSPVNTDAGSYSNVRISASDGQASTTLSPFTVSVNGVTATTGSVTLSWTAPTENTDGTLLTNLAGYHIYYGTDPTALSNNATVLAASLSQFQVNSLAAGTWYFSIRSYNSAGVESGDSTMVNKVIA